MMDYEYGQELTIQDLPVELLEKILSYNQPNLVREVMTVCSQWLELSPSIWRNKAIVRWGKEILSIEDSNGILTNANLRKFFTAHKPISPVKKDGSGEIDWFQYFMMRNSFEGVMASDTHKEYRIFTPANVLKIQSSSLSTPPQMGHLIIDSFDYFAQLNDEKLFNRVTSLHCLKTRSHTLRLYSLCNHLQANSCNPKFVQKVVMAVTSSFNRMHAASLTKYDAQLLKEIVHMIFSTGPQPNQQYFGYGCYDEKQKLEPIAVLQDEAFDVLSEYLTPTTEENVAMQALWILRTLYRRGTTSEKGQHRFLRFIKIAFEHSAAKIRDSAIEIMKIYRYDIIYKDWLSDDEVRLMLDFYFVDKINMITQIADMLKYVPRIGILMDDDKFTQLRELLLKLFVHANNPSTIFYYCSQLLEVGKHFGARMKQHLPAYNGILFNMFAIIAADDKKSAMKIYDYYLRLGFIVLGDDFMLEAKNIIKSILNEQNHENIKNLFQTSGDLIISQHLESDDKMFKLIVSTLFEFLPEDFIRYGTEASPFEAIVMNSESNRYVSNDVPQDFIHFLKQLVKNTKIKQTQEKARQIMKSFVSSSKEDDKKYNEYFSSVHGRGLFTEQAKDWDGREMSLAISTLNKISVLRPNEFEPYLQNLLNANIALRRVNWYSCVISREDSEVIQLFDTMKSKLKLADWFHYIRVLGSYQYCSELRLMAHVSYDFKYFPAERKMIIGLINMVQSYSKINDDNEYKEIVFKNLIVSWPSQTKHIMERFSNLYPLEHVAPFCSVVYGIPFVQCKIMPNFLESLTEDNFSKISNIQRNAFIRMSTIKAASNIEPSIVGLTIFSPEDMYATLVQAINDSRFDTGIDFINQFMKKVNFDEFDFRFFGL